MPDPLHLPRAGSHLVAAVYALAGYHVSWPLEPAAYDLVVDSRDGQGLRRVQVKTCTTKQHGNWICWVTRSKYAPAPGGKRRAAYPVGSIDVLAVVDGDLQVYLIPFGLVAHKSAVTLRALERYQAGRLLLTTRGDDG
jgi:hypothetical protein